MEYVSYLLVFILLTQKFRAQSTSIPQSQDEIQAFASFLKNNEDTLVSDITRKETTRHRKRDADGEGLLPLTDEDKDKQRQIHESFEKMLRFITVVGQIDSYVSDRAKSFIKTLNRLIDSDEDDRSF